MSLYDVFLVKKILILDLIPLIVFPLTLTVIWLPNYLRQRNLPKVCSKSLANFKKIWRKSALNILKSAYLAYQTRSNCSDFPALFGSVA